MEQRKKLVQVYFTEKDKADIQRKAASVGMSLSGYIRFVVLEKVAQKNGGDDV